MVRRVSSELEISVSAPARRPQAATLRCPAAARPISSGPAKWWSVERTSEEAVVVPTAGTTQPGPSEGPLARCAKRPATTVGLPNGLSTHSPFGAGQWTGSDAWIARQRSWHSGMRTIDCLGESRVRENRMHGLGRGDWGDRRPGEMEYAPGGKPTGLSPSASPDTPNQFPTSPGPEVVNR